MYCFLVPEIYYLNCFFLQIVSNIRYKVTHFSRLKKKTNIYRVRISFALPSSSFSMVAT